MAAFVETICPGVTFTVEADHMLYAGRTYFQTVHVFGHNTLGRVLALDNVVQTTELDEFVYHEMLTHTPVFAHGAVRTALIIGGGDGGIARELLRHPLDRVVMVEIDGEVVSLCREHLPRLSNGAFDDPRLELVIGDGATDLQTKTLELLGSGRGHILLNLERVPYLDASGIGELIACSEHVRYRGGVLKLLKPSAKVRDLLQLAHLDGVFEIFCDERKARASFLV